MCPGHGLRWRLETHSIWVSEQLRELGHEVIVANETNKPRNGMVGELDSAESPKRE
jgi:hypothetical protein